MEFPKVPKNFIYLISIEIWTLGVTDLQLDLQKSYHVFNELTSFNE